MKTLEELAAIRDRMKSKVALREESNEVRIVVGMATCGIAAGARPVLNAFVEEVEKAGLVGQASGAKPREVLIQDEMSLENLLSNLR